MIFYRTLFFMPVVFPLSLISVIWILIYAPGPNGMMNALLSAISYGPIPPWDRLNAPYPALPTMMLCSIWQGVGFRMIVILAGLQAIPEVLCESARIDKAGARSRFRHVTLPQLRNPIIFTALVTTILAFRVYAQVEIMTRGGPIDATTTVMYETVETVFERLQVGQASAMNMVFFLLVLLVTLVQPMLLNRSGSSDETATGNRQATGSTRRAQVGIGWGLSAVDGGAVALHFTGAFYGGGQS